MTFGDEDEGFGASKEESKKIFDAYVEAGGNFIDTANNYADGASERLVGEFIKHQRESFVLGTKYTINTKGRDPNAGGNQRKNMFQALEASLARLETSYVDIFWVHSWDYLTPVSEVLRGLDDLVRMGKVLYVGVSSLPAWVMSRACTMAEENGWTRPEGMQISYSLIERTVEREHLPLAEALELAVTAWSPLGGGVLTGKYNGPEPVNDVRYSRGSSLFLNDQNRTRNLEIASELAALGREIGRPPSQLALAWLRQNRQSNVIPIIGAKRFSQLVENLGCLEFELTDDQMTRLDRMSEIDKGYPRNLHETNMSRRAVFGETEHLIGRPPVRD